MLILLDNSNLFAGGGVQVAISFLNDLSTMDTVGQKFIVVQSHNLAGLVKQDLFPDNFIFVELSTNEQTSILARSNALKKLERIYKPDVVFTTFGPSYYKSKCPKIVGFAIPHIIYNDSPYFKELSIKYLIKDKIMSVLKSLAFRRNSDVLIFESEEARRRFSKVFKKNTYTVNNTLNEIFYDRSRWSTMSLEKTSSSKFNILSIAANYPHKNLNIIPQVIKELLKKGIRDFKFILTLEEKDIILDPEYQKYVEFIGNVEIKKVPSLYQASDILFMPTLLEIFSTSYLEAMFMEVPIVTSSLPFSSDVCGNAAVYCEPLSAISYASAIERLKNDKLLRSQLIKRGKQRLENFGTSMDRTNKYLEIIHHIKKNENTK